MLVRLWTAPRDFTALSCRICVEKRGRLGRCAYGIGLRDTDESVRRPHHSSGAHHHLGDDHAGDLDIGERQSRRLDVDAARTHRRSRARALAERVEASRTRGDGDTTYALGDILRIYRRRSLYVSRALSAYYAAIGFFIVTSLT